MLSKEDKKKNQEILSKNYDKCIQERRDKYFNDLQRERDLENELIKEDHELMMNQFEKERQRKEYLKMMQYNDMKKQIEERRQRYLKEREEYRQPQLVSIEMNHEKRIQNLQDHFSKLAEITDKNTLNLENYKKDHSAFNRSISANNYHSSRDLKPLSPYLEKKQHINENFGAYKVHSDITDRFINDYIVNQDYNDYMNKNKECLNYNKSLSKNYSGDISDSFKGKMLIEKKQNELYDNYYKNYALEEKKLEKEQKQKYKQFLDEQNYFRIYNKLKGENLSVKDLNLHPQFNDRNTIEENDYGDYPNSSYLNKNHYVEVNPYNRKSYDLGNSYLTRNPILNPEINYKNNRYLFPKTGANNLRGNMTSPIMNAGQRSISNVF